MKPRYLTEEELAATESDPSQGASQAYAWQCDPTRYGFTRLGGKVILPNEAESTTGVLIGWPSYGCTVPELTELVRTGVDRTQVTVLVAPNHQEGAIACLQRRGITPEQIAKIDFAPVPVGSVWIRDYGPEVVTQADGSRRLVDMSYYPQLSGTCNNLVGRADDDVSPTKLAALWNVPVERPKVRLEGGNLLTDGAGSCFRAKRNANARNCFSGWCYTEDELNYVIGQSHGCKVHALESMVGGVIDHIDMYMTFLSRRTVLVGRYDAADDADNAAILDRNAAYLAKLGYRVVRTPMPKPFCRQAAMNCMGVESQVTACGSKTEERVWATYMNSIRLGNALAVPVYKWVPKEYRATIEAQERETLATYQRELDREFGKGKVQVVPVQADALIPCQGSLHCTTMTYR